MKGKTLLFLLILIVGFAFGVSTMIIGDKITTRTIDVLLLNVDNVTDSVQGFIGFNDKRLSNVTDPVESLDAVTKLWLEEQIELHCSNKPLVVDKEVIINNYTYLTTDVISSKLLIEVDNGTEFEDGDKILIIQMQDAVHNNHGVYEFATIASGGGTNNFTLINPLENAYYSGTFNQVDSVATQIVRVPTYSDVTVLQNGSVTAPRWNGFIGGIVIFEADNVTVDGKIDVNGKGFRGGSVASAGPGCPSGGPSACTLNQQGESYEGIGEQSTEKNNGGGGGTFGSSPWFCIFPAAGSAGYGTPGETGSASGCGTKGKGGDTYGIADLSKIYLGSGGGKGWAISRGGYGGGIIIITANNIALDSNSLLSNGGDGDRGADYQNPQGGGGSGGSVLVRAQTIDQQADSVKIDGGSGTNKIGSPSGNGGLGRVHLEIV